MEDTEHDAQDVAVDERKESPIPILVDAGRYYFTFHVYHASMKFPKNACNIMIRNFTSLPC